MIISNVVSLTLFNSVQLQFFLIKPSLQFLAGFRWLLQLFSKLFEIFEQFVIVMGFNVKIRSARWLLWLETVPRSVLNLHELISWWQFHILKISEAVQESLILHVFYYYIFIRH